MCVSKLIIIGPDNGLSPGRRQAIIWTNAGILLIRALGTNLTEVLGEIHTFSFKKNVFENLVFEMASILPRPQCVNITPSIDRIHTGPEPPIIILIDVLVPDCDSVDYSQTSNMRHSLMGNIIVVRISPVGAAPTNGHLHSRLNTWLQRIGQRQRQNETWNI